MFGIFRKANLLSLTTREKLLGRVALELLKRLKRYEPKAKVKIPIDIRHHLLSLGFDSDDLVDFRHIPKVRKAGDGVYQEITEHEFLSGRYEDSE